MELIIAAFLMIIGISLILTYFYHLLTKKPAKVEGKKPLPKVGDKVLTYHYQIDEIIDVLRDGSYRCMNSYEYSYDSKNYHFTYTNHLDNVILGQITEIHRETTHTESAIANIPESVEVYLKLDYKKKPVKFTYELDMTPSINEVEHSHIVDGILITKRLKSELPISSEGCYVWSDIRLAIDYYQKHKGVEINPAHVLEASVKYNNRPAKIEETIIKYSFCGCK